MLSRVKGEYCKVRETYAGVGTIVLLYWRGYGGWRAILRSPYFHAALLLATATGFGWLLPWYDTTLSVLPNILGFAIGGYAIWLAFGDSEFRDLMTAPGPGNGTSAYMDFTTTFAHFVVVQVVALLWALWAKAAHYDVLPDTFLGRLYAWLPWIRWCIQDCLAVVGGFVGSVLFVYALTSAAAAGFAILRIAYMYDAFNRLGAEHREAQRTFERRVRMEQAQRE